MISYRALFLLIAFTSIFNCTTVVMASESSPVIKSIQGGSRVKVTGKGRGDGRDLTKGSALFSHDVLRPTRQQKVEIACNSSAQSRQIPVNQPTLVENFCNLREKPDIRDPQEDYLPGGSDSKIPYMLSPRIGKVQLKDLPIRWNNSNPNEEYTLKITNRDDTKEVVVGRLAQYVYPVGELTNEEKYTIKIYSKSSTSEKEDLEFKVLSVSEQKGIERDIENLTQQLGEKYISKTDYIRLLYPQYEERNLFSDAINLLESELKSSSKEDPARVIWLTELGKFNARIGANLKAEQYYTEALNQQGQMVKSEKDADLEIRILEGLAAVKLLVGKPKESEDFERKIYQKASLDKYREISIKLNDLKSRLNGKSV